VDAEVPKKKKSGSAKPARDLQQVFLCSCRIKKVGNEAGVNAMREKVSGKQNEMFFSS
jgi:hypothetical protein